MSKGKILVTGGAGFIGSHVVDQLIKMNEEVIVLDDLSGGFLKNVNQEVAFIEGSITDEILVKSIFEKNKIEYIFHIAAYAAEGLSHFIKKFNYENNLIGSINLINCAVNHETRCFIFTSSIAVYGSAQLPMREDMIPIPEDSYGIAKFAVEQELRASHEIFDLNYIIFRPHNVYGERQNLGDKYRNVVGIFMNQIMQGKPLTIFGDGEQTRAFTHIDDVAPIIANSIYNQKAYNEVFNIGADHPFSVNQLTDELCKCFNVDKKVIHLEERNEVKHAFSDHSKVEEYFGKTTHSSLSDGLGEMAKWAKEAGIKTSKEFENIEIRKNLPKAWKR